MRKRARKKGVEKPAAQRIREACADGLEQAVPKLVALATGDGASATTQIAAFDKLGKYGVGTRVTVQITGEDLGQLFARVAQEAFGLSRESIDLFVERLRAELAKLEAGEVDDESEKDPDSG